MANTPRRLSRNELYDLVWSQPMKTLAPQFGISDVALKKTCAKAHVPVPDRGWWAKQQAGKKVVRTTLPLRPPGMSDEVTVGGGRQYWYRSYTNEELLGPLPDPPTFDEAIEAVRERVKPQIRKVGVTKAYAAPHPTISALLQDDERRKENQRTSSYVASWETPRFDSPYEQRRLKLLNAIFLAVAGSGGKPWIRPKDPYRSDESETIGIAFYQTNVHLRLEQPSQPKRSSRSTEKPTSSQTPLRLSIVTFESSERLGWQDDDDSRLESHLPEIALEIAVIAELQYRESQIRSHEWRVERKAELEEQERQRILEAQRKEAERLARLEKARVDRLLGEATALRQANDIRAYVDAVRTITSNSAISSSPEELQRWCAWALAQAERIDPVKSGVFLQLRNTEEADS